MIGNINTIEKESWQNLGFDLNKNSISLTANLITADNNNNTDNNQKFKTSKGLHRTY
ncbi:MAG: hypothetical protein KC550_00820 [Nanoarchaeota archaeon]|nr:hypothetical protein [Nanoarchaeota archaeon]